MAQTWGLDLSKMPSWEVTNEFIQRHNLQSVKDQQAFLIEAWGGAERRLRHEINQRMHTPSFLVEASALRDDALGKRRYEEMAKALHLRHGGRAPVDPWRDLERAARVALARAVDAFNFLEDTELADVAHQHSHKIAALIGGVFGCDIQYIEGAYWDTCPISLMHRRCGMSVGFTATRRCSLCGDDIDECEHLLGVLYEVRIQRSADGTCSACGRHSCSHVEGEIVSIYPHAVMGDLQVHEISLVSRPRDPLARFTRVEFDPQDLARSLGGEPDGREIRCYRCLHPCEGFATLEE
ncbi:MULTISPECIES: hypothetical protein [unclassified Streptomyces]|uniref:hypothetical protein n=1 Tax=unclassified Streptomyces TaxID=2593676 RepID=UPI001E2E9FF2|nr:MULTISPECIES: hypothetical protein [unclassified Streptomyces]MCE3030617.1 hypothetical protein [Streptomyces sp. CMSTAAHL-2]